MSAIKSSSTYLATIQTIVADRRRTNPMPDVDNSSFSVVQLGLFLCYSESRCYHRCVQPENPAVASIPTRKATAGSLIFDRTADSAIDHSAHTIINVVRLDLPTLFS